MNTLETMRLDKWLWCARFYKTRSLATEEIGKGRVTVNGQLAKPARDLRRGDTVALRQGPVARTVHVLGLSGARGPAPVAQLLYEETADSIVAREKAAELRRLAPNLLLPCTKAAPPNATGARSIRSAAPAAATGEAAGVPRSTSERQGEKARATALGTGRDLSHGPSGIRSSRRIRNLNRDITNTAWGALRGSSSSTHPVAAGGTKPNAMPPMAALEPPFQSPPHSGPSMPPAKSSAPSAEPPARISTPMRLAKAPRR